MLQPKLLSKIWAALGLKNSIPDSRSDGLAQGAATYDEGFPSITMTPIAQGGKAPSGKDMNGVLNELSAHIVHLNKGGLYKFDITFAGKINGYDKGAVLLNDAETAFFVSLVSQNKHNFNTSSDYHKHWAKLADVQSIQHITPLKLTNLTQNTLLPNGHTHEIEKASLSKVGITQLFSGLDSDAEDMAATPKAIKTLKDLIDAITRNLGNYIPNSKKSNAVNSNSADTVATSVAVKTANDNANGRVSKAGDTMTGNLIVPYLKTTGNYLSVTANNADFAGLDIIREGRLGNWLARMEAMPDKRWKFWTENSHEVYLPARSGTVALEHEVVPRNGDTTINGRHFFRNEQSWIGIVSTGTGRSGLDFTNNGGQFSQCSVQAVDVGGYANELHFFTTPPGDNYNTDRRHHSMTLGFNGDVWTKKYGWLQDAFNKPMKHAFYPNHYNGAEVWKIPIGQGPGCLMITTMLVGLNHNPEEFFLPEKYAGWATPTAVDVGYMRHSVGISMQENNSKVVIWGNRTMGVHIQVIGFGQY